MSITDIQHDECVPELLGDCSSLISSAQLAEGFEAIQIMNYA
jgi:hypothetical protein